MPSVPDRALWGISVNTAAGAAVGYVLASAIEESETFSGLSDMEPEEAAVTGAAIMFTVSLVMSLYGDEVA